MPAISSRWYWMDNGATAGPITWPELQSLAKSGRLRASDMVRREGRENWQPANTAKDVEGVSAPRPTLPALMPAQPNFIHESASDDAALTAGAGISAGRMFLGLLMCGGGICLSVLGYNAAVAKGGGTYFVYTGAIIWGFVIFVQSFSGHRKD
jgi:hypothetical protein